MDDCAMEDSINRDRLSELPYSLIHHILSFLSMRDVVSTTLLSKRWNNLWDTVPCLRFREVLHDGARFRNFVNRALLMWSGTNILKFEISIDNVFDSSLAGDMNLWVTFAVKYNVQELKICLSYEPDEFIMKNAYWVPQFLYSCSSVRKLSLTGFKFRIRGPPSWNQLKNLHISSYRLSELSINRIMLGSPQLEVFKLSLVGDCDNLSIMSTSLKVLVIRRHLFFYMNKSSLNRVFRICCPNLEIFDFCGCLYGKCLFTNVSSLIDATLHFDADFDGDVDDLRLNEMFGEALRQVFSTRVERVELSVSCARWCLQVVHASPKKYLLSPSVKCLTIGAGDIHEFGEMMDLLGIFPNQKMLTRIHWRASLSSNSFLLQLKTVDIFSDWSDVSSIFWFLEFLLKHAIRLEKLVLRFSDITSYPQTSLFQISEKLVSMPRSSPTAKVILKNRIVDPLPVC